MKFAIIGCGRISTNHIKAATDNSLELVAVCDVLPQRMEDLLKKHNLHNDKTIKRYTDYKKMLKIEDITLAAIATESGKHAKIALDCLDSGVNVIIEKPMAMSMSEANLIVKKAADTGLKVSACHQNRFNLAVQEMHNAVISEKFGKISHGSVHVRWNRSSDYYTQAPWRGTWEEDGGCLMNQCIHGIDLLRWMMNDDVLEVFGAIRRQHHDYLEAEDVGVAVVKFKNGSVATIEGTTNVYPQNLEETLYLFGETGTVKLGGKSTNSIDVWAFKSDSESKAGFHEETENVYGNGHSSLYKDVIKSIENNTQPYVDATAGKNALEVILAIYKSQKTGLPIRLPLEDFATIDMKGEF